MRYLQLLRCRLGLALSVQMIEFRKTIMAPNFYYRRQVIEIFECDDTFLDKLEAEDLVHSVEDESEQERVFPPDQVERIRIINNLVRELDVNLAGVEVILAMRENMIRMQRQFDEILEILCTRIKRKNPRIRREDCGSAGLRSSTI